MTVDAVTRMAGSEREQRLERLLNIGRALTSELDLDVLLDRVLLTARELTSARFAAVGILDDRRRELAQFLTSGADRETTSAIGNLPRGHGILGLLIDDPHPLRLRDVSDHPRSYGFPAGHPAMRGFLGVPILIRGQAWGNLYLTEPQRTEEFTDEDEESAVILAEWAAIAIENARLFGTTERRRHELERAVHAMEAAMDIAVAVGGETDLGRVLELISKRARALVQASALIILLKDGDRLVVAAHAGQASPAPGASIPVEGSTSGRVLALGEPELVADVRSGLSIGAHAMGIENAQSALLVPLLFRGQGQGVLAAFDRIGANARFDADDERALRAFAASAATAVATARSVSEQRLRDSLVAAEAERTRWARELHDETLQGLGALKLALAAALRSEGDAREKIVRTAHEQVEREIAGLRAIISDLRPAALDELGLAPALRTLAKRMDARHGLKVTTDIDLGEERLADDVETVAYRIAQEALTNAAKHAGTDRAELTVRREERRLVVCVRDYGVGLPPDAGQNSGFGLRGMRERAALARGEITVSAADPGTAVELTLPLAG